MKLTFDEEFNEVQRRRLPCQRSPVDVEHDQITKTLLHIHFQTINIVLYYCLVNNSL